jgi:hypothetical protein
MLAAAVGGPGSVGVSDARLAKRILQLLRDLQLKHNLDALDGALTVAWQALERFD